jgi:hypothetical protein
MDDVTRRQYERAAELIKRATAGDEYAAKWAAIHCQIAAAAMKEKGTDHVHQ